MKLTDNQQIALAITGASGGPYAQRLLECLLAQKLTVHLMISAAGRLVLADELDWKLPARPRDMQQALAEMYDCDLDLLQIYGEQQWYAPLASGSHRVPTLIVCPCTMGTLAAIAGGHSDNLIHRAADVMLKENRRLILVPREAPFSAIHLENMLKLARLGVCILPPSPGFYFRPDSLQAVVDFVVARVLDQAGVEHDLMPRWGDD